MASIGKFEIEQLSEGLFEAHDDGTFIKIDQNELTGPGQGRRSGPDFLSPEEGEDDYEPPFENFGDDEESSRDYGLQDYMRSLQLGHQSNKTRIGIDPVLIRNGRHTILLDTGLGLGMGQNTEHNRASNLKANLNIFGIDCKEVTHVILSHLHTDHASGATYTDGELKTRATFPNAFYYVQSWEWEHALSLLHDKRNAQNGAGYAIDELYRLVADQRVVFLEESYEKIVPGVFTIWTGGHTPGHQIVRIQDQHDIGYYLGDLIPNDTHLNFYSMDDMDVDPDQTMAMKQKVLKEAYQERAMLLFYHSRYAKYGHLSKDRQEKYVLKADR